MYARAMIRATRGTSSIAAMRIVAVRPVGPGGSTALGGADREPGEEETLTGGVLRDEAASPGGVTEILGLEDG
jgi:hypothetical protein